MTTVSVLAGPERRRRWTSAEKLRIVNECETAGLSVAEFARQRDIHPNLIHYWRRQARTGALLPTSRGELRFAPISIVAAADPPPTTASQAKNLPVFEVVLRNGRVLRLRENVAPGNAASLADALEGCR
jgi:transposase